MNSLEQQNVIGYQLIFSHAKVLINNKVSKMLKPTSYQETIKGTVVDEAHLVIDW